MSVQRTQRWASIGTALAALTANESDIEKASGVLTICICICMVCGSTHYCVIALARESHFKMLIRSLDVMLSVSALL